MASDTHRNALKPGYRVHWYQIERILGQGGFGITYLADDTNLNQKVALKEYLPVEVAVRDRDYSVHPVSQNHDETFRWGLDRFLEEARTLARFDHPNIVRVLSVFEMNNTAYMVMRYENGKSFQQMLPKRTTIDEKQLTATLFPVLDGLTLVHEAGFIHRDVKPANIFIRDDGSPVLLDFGSARQSLGEATRTLTTLVSPGYAPFEQYYSKSDKQGPWTDIYGLGATMYRAVVGVPPMNAVDRSEGIIKQGQDPLVPAAVAAANRYSPQFLQAIDWSLRFDENDRPKNIDQWKQSFEGDAIPIAARSFAGSDATTAVRSQNDAPTANVDLPLEATVPLDETKTAVSIPPPKKSRLKYVIAFLVVIALLGVGLAAVKKGKQARQTAQIKPGIVEESPPVNEAPPPSAEDSKQRVERLLRAAKADIKLLRLSKPPGNNALEKYRQVLEQDPDNKDAKKGIRKIVEAYVELGKNAAERKDYERAGLYLKEALSIAPNSKPLRKALEKLEKLRRRAD